MATIKDVAKLAGVSISTVSRVLNGDTRVGADKARRIIAAVDRLGYQRNELGRNLRVRSQNVWALLIGNIEHSYHTTVTRGVEDVARQEGYAVLLCNTDEDPEREREYLELAIRNRVAGILVTPTPSLAARLPGHPPIVALDRPISGQLDAVLVDTRTAAAKATARLRAAGARRIGCITGPPEIYTTAQRVAGFREVSRRGPVRHTDFTPRGGYAAALELLATGIDALLVTSSLLSIGVVMALREHGHVVGGDVGLAVFDTAPWTELLDPRIVLVAQPAYDVGRVGARLLLDQIAGVDRPAERVVLEAVLIHPAG